MNIEEKARAYDEALKDMQAIYPKLNGDMKLAVEHAFPQLVESEDERIRKILIHIVKGACNKYGIKYIGDEISEEKLLAYLEKQKEQIPYIDFVIKPHKGDDNNPYDMPVSEAQEYAIKRGFGIPFNDGEVYVDERHLTQTIGNIIRWADEHPKEQKPVQSDVEKEYVRTLKSLISDFIRGKEDVDREYYQQIFDWLDERHIEQKPVDFPTTDEEVNEFLETHSKVEVPEKYKTPDFVFSKQEYESYPIISKDTTSVKPAEWSEEDEKIRKALIWHLKADVDFVSNGVTKAECLAYLDKQKAQKQEWSDEDKRILKGIIGLVDHNQHYNVSNKEMLAWLKSLRPQPKQEWSEKDEETLKDIIAGLEATKQLTYRHEPSGRACYNKWIAWLKSISPVSKESLQSWKPNEEQMEAFKGYIEGFQARAEAAVGGWNNFDVMIRLYEQLKKL